MPGRNQMSALLLLLRDHPQKMPLPCRFRGYVLTIISHYGKSQNRAGRGLAWAKTAPCPNKDAITLCYPRGQRASDELPSRSNVPVICLLALMKLPSGTAQRRSMIRCR